MLPDLLHGEERKVWGDGGYQGQTEAIKQAAPHAQDMTCKRGRPDRTYITFRSSPASYGFQ
jgi:IS5 family transposase